MRPAVHVASASTDEEARELHRRAWNMSDAPFLIVVLPTRVHVYSNFQYDQTSPSEGLIVSCNIDEISTRLADFHSSEINSGKIWSNQSKNLNLNGRVRVVLLRHLKELANYLIVQRNLKSVVAHGLIVKFIYVRYLLDRGIISQDWLATNNLTVDAILSVEASLENFRHLIKCLEDRFNGRVFPFPLAGPDAPTDEDIQTVAAVFRGAGVVAQQLPLFDVYRFEFIPTELLSSIYEQFLSEEGTTRQEGAYYTPEVLADYVVSDIDEYSPLTESTKILDPSCGSGIFLVLAFRRLVEYWIRSNGGRMPSPTQLAKLLSQLYGVERDEEACYITEFSLLLTLLSFVEPPDLAQNNFRFPSLHNKQIFHADFFDPDSIFAQKRITFDWIIGNPPWAELKMSTHNQEHAKRWMVTHSQEFPVGRYRLSEAFLWHSSQRLRKGGTASLLLMATTLVNEHSAGFRKAFFASFSVLKVTNFSNLSGILFDSRTNAVAASIVFAKKDVQATEILHYAPLLSNQVLLRPKFKGRTSLWSLTIFDGDVQNVPISHAKDGETWKLALWGTYRDRESINKLERLFANRLSKLSSRPGWSLGVGLAVKQQTYLGDKTAVPELEGMPQLNARAMSNSKHRLSIPNEVLVSPSFDPVYVRQRSGLGGLALARAPHLFINHNFAAYSNKDYVLPHPKIGLSAPSEDEAYLKALSLMLNSSVFRYLLFFRSTAWGFSIDDLELASVKDLPIPTLNPEQIRFLNASYLTLALLDTGEDPTNLQKEIDTIIESTFKIPRQIATIAREFWTLRYPLNNGKLSVLPLRKLTDAMLKTYGTELRSQLESFTEKPHVVTLGRQDSVGFCSVRLAHRAEEGGVVIENKMSGAILKLWQSLLERRSQWVYVQRSFRHFTGNRITFYKPNRVMDWSRTQAMLDADDMIAEILAAEGRG